MLETFEALLKRCTDWEPGGSIFLHGGESSACAKDTRNRIVKLIFHMWTSTGDNWNTTNTTTYNNQHTLSYTNTLGANTSNTNAGCELFIVATLRQHLLQLPTSSQRAIATCQFISPRPQKSRWKSPVGSGCSKGEIAVDHWHFRILQDTSGWKFIKVQSSKHQLSLSHPGETRGDTVDDVDVKSLESLEQWIYMDLIGPLDLHFSLFQGQLNMLDVWRHVWPNSAISSNVILFVL